MYEVKESTIENSHTSWDCHETTTAYNKELGILRVAYIGYRHSLVFKGPGFEFGRSSGFSDQSVSIATLDV